MTVHRQHTCIRDHNVRKLRASSHIDKCTSVEPKFKVFQINFDSIISGIQTEKVIKKIFTPKLNCLFLRHLELRPLVQTLTST